MKYTILTLLLTMTSPALFGQSNDIWTAFWDEDETSYGYKDKNDVIKIEPKFIWFLNARKFENIIAVTEEAGTTWRSYYLTKTGREIEARLYTSDMSVDCECEGFIRFKDPETHLVGMLNRHGDVAIPAEYNDLMRVMNGMIVGLKGAEKEYWDERRLSDAHFSWIGGKEVLIDTLNNVIIDNFTYDNSLNFFTLKKADVPDPDTIRKSFLAVDGSYYSFVDSEKEFKQWLTDDLFSDLTSEKLINNSSDTITWESAEDYGKTDKRKLITDNFSTLKNGMLEILNPACDFSILGESFYTFVYNDKEFEKYYDNCGRFKEWIYPAMVLVISHDDENDYSQNHYTFLRTDDGYKLISIVVRNEEIK